MRTFLLEFAPLLVWGVCGVQLVLLTRFPRYFHTPQRGPALCVFFIGLGLFYDALVIALGSLLEGPLLQALSQLRFLSHGVLVPLLFPLCGYALTLRPGG